VVYIKVAVFLNVTPCFLVPIYRTKSVKPEKFLTLIINYSSELQGISHKSTEYFKKISQNFEKRLLASSCLSVRPSVRMEQLCFHWMYFYQCDIWRFF